MDRGAWWAYSPWGHKESDTTEQLSTLEGGNGREIAYLLALLIGRYTYEVKNKF